MRRTRWIVLGIGLVLLAGCGGSDEDAAPTPIPTRTLVPPTATAITDPQNLTPTPTDLPSPGSLAPQVTEVSLAILSPEAQAVIDQAKAALIDEFDVGAGEIQLLGLDRFTWHDEALGCPARYEDGHTEAMTSHGYRVIFSAEGEIYSFHTDDQDTFFRCEDENWLALEGDPQPTDPIAQSLVDLTLDDAADQFPDSGTAPRLVSLIAVSWPDSSLGCPRSGGEYEDRITAGYRIVFRAGDETVIYHTSIADFVRCSPDDEILPGILR